MKKIFKMPKTFYGCLVEIREDIDPKYIYFVPDNILKTKYKFISPFPLKFTKKMKKMLKRMIKDTYAEGLIQAHKPPKNE